MIEELTLSPTGTWILFVVIVVVLSIMVWDLFRDKPMEVADPVIDEPSQSDEDLWRLEIQGHLIWAQGRSVYDGGWYDEE